AIPWMAFWQSRGSAKLRTVLQATVVFPRQKELRVRQQAASSRRSCIVPAAPVVVSAPTPSARRRITNGIKEKAFWQAAGRLVLRTILQGFLSSPRDCVRQASSTFGGPPKNGVFPTTNFLLVQSNRHFASRDRQGAVSVNFQRFFGASQCFRRRFSEQR